MPLLLCPNDNGSMQTVRRGGVEFDMCPTCRGVWLDRGELEKLMASDGPAPPPPPASFTQPQYTQYRPRDDDDRRSHDGRDHSGKPRKKSSIFDIFD